MESLSTSIFLFFLGLLILIKGAGLLVKGSVRIATYLGISKWTIGVLIVGIGTSVPELAITIASAFSGSPVGIGTIVGSNTFNTLFIIGISALFIPLTVKREWVTRDLAINAGAILFCAFLFLFPLLGNHAEFVGITRPEAILLFVAFLCWGWYITHQKKNSIDEKVTHGAVALLSTTFFILFGIAGVFFGGKWVIQGAAVIGALAGMSDAFIGATILGIGTSISELTVSLTAIFKKENSIGIGNVIGSNIFDFLGIFSIAGLLSPIPFPKEMMFDLGITFGSIVLLGMLLYRNKNTLSRAHAALLVCIYIGYIATIALRSIG